MSVELKVPSVGESITQVQIGDWLKNVGDHVQRDEVLVMIETDKVTVELPAPVAGVVAEIRVAKGQSASVGDVIGTLEEATLAATPGSVSGAVPARAAEPAAGAVSSTPSTEPVPASAPAPSQARVMPAAERALHHAGLRPEQVAPTGPGGRLLKEDVLRVAQLAAEPPRAGAGEEVVAMTPIRKRIAERLVQSLQTTAQLTTFNEIDMSAVLALRKEYQERFQAKYQIKLGIMSFFVKAAVEALKLVPEANAEVRGTDIVYKNYFDIGVAVGSGKGLVVPVVRGAERLSFAEVELAIADLGRRAAENKLKLEELQGGTFTISNGGIYGNLLSTPILNPPQSAILGLHAIQDRAVVRDGQIVIRPMMYAAVSYDHRIIDGREAVTFLKRIKDCVEQPSRILLEV